MFTILKDKIACLLVIVLMGVSCQNERPDEDFILNSTANEEFSLNELKKHKAAVFVFLDYECPLSQNYTNKINDLSDKYKAEDIQFYSVFPNLSADNAEVKMFKRKYKMDMPFLGDPQKKLTNYLDATITPEVFLVDSNKTVLYSGRIDNWASALGVKRQITTSNDLDEALNDFINNKEIKINKTEAVGCIIE
jgi:peroxiredoxin